VRVEHGSLDKVCGARASGTAKVQGHKAGSTLCEAARCWTAEGRSGRNAAVQPIAPWGAGTLTSTPLRSQAHFFVFIFLVQWCQVRKLWVEVRVRGESTRFRPKEEKRSGRVDSPRTQCRRHAVARSFQLKPCVSRLLILEHFQRFYGLWTSRKRRYPIVV
jgi:hypothetical protein